MYHDENASYGNVRSVQQPALTSGLGQHRGTKQFQTTDGTNGKHGTGLTERKALGNITNSGVLGLTVGPPNDTKATVGRQALTTRTEGRNTVIEKECGVPPRVYQECHPPEMMRAPQIIPGGDAAGTVEDLLAGGIERAAGATWEEQQALLEISEDVRISNGLTRCIERRRGAVPRQMREVLMVRVTAPGLFCLCQQEELSHSCFHIFCCRIIVIMIMDT